MDEEGNEVGRHAGFWRFTPGQRKGLGVSATEPLYALRSDAATNTVVIGHLDALARTHVDAAGELYVPAARVEAKLRYRSDAIPARVEATEHGFSLDLDQPAYGVAPGQAAVLYEDGVVVGSGRIEA